ncbi:MAG: hypothetical protein HZA50_18385 [Planctomycetes bacterium]|nr:hypothetical protein [Planctomycetota bacterium]
MSTRIQPLRWPRFLNLLPAGYAFHHNSGVVDAAYYPYLNQIHLFEQSQTAQISSVLAHEFSHAVMHYLTPASLFPLSCYLFKEELEPVHANYEDIVESVAEIATPLILQENLFQKIPKFTNGRFGRLAEGYLSEAERFSKYAASTVVNPARESLITVVTLMSNVFSRKPNQAKHVLHLLQQIPHIDSWSDSSELLVNLYMSISINRPKQSHFLPTLPRDIHYQVWLILLLFSGALNAAVDHPGRLIGSIPALLNTTTRL